MVLPFIRTADVEGSRAPSVNSVGVFPNQPEDSMAPDQEACADDLFLIGLVGCLALRHSFSLRLVGVYLQIFKGWNWKTSL